MADDSDIVWLSDGETTKEKEPVPSTSNTVQLLLNGSLESSIVEDSFLCMQNKVTLTPTRSTGESSRRSSRKRSSFESSFNCKLNKEEKQSPPPVQADLINSKEDSPMFVIEESFLSHQQTTSASINPSTKKTPNLSIIEDSFVDGLDGKQFDPPPIFPSMSRKFSPDLIVLDDDSFREEQKMDKKLFTPPSNSSSLTVEEKENDQATTKKIDKNDPLLKPQKRQDMEELNEEISEKEQKAKQRETKRLIRKDELAVKVEEKEAKQRKRLAEKQQKEVEKKRARIEREIQSSTKTNAEKYLFCHTAIRCAFADRDLEKQLQVITDGQDPELIEFHRAYIDIAEKDDGDVERFEYQETQSFFVYVITGEALTNENKIFGRTVERIKLSLPLGTSHLVIACLGLPKISANKLFSLNIDLFASLRAQLKICENADILAHHLVQMTKGLAKFNPHTGHSSAQFQDGAKGIRDGPDLVKDWWSLMLSRIYRLSDASRRAIMRKIENPVQGIDWIRSVGVDVATKQIADLVAENGRRVGVAMAVRLVRMLSDTNGTSIVE
ncbi:unnamed protein product, partial [Mesorhabditis belari]|uniref:Uncharacterized protein n=1 Tax=Mesorhabditis belari TaxID=2138241 RepID=A0AAF3ETG5_9BILA